MSMATPDVRNPLNLPPDLLVPKDHRGARHLTSMRVRGGRYAIPVARAAPGPAVFATIFRSSRPWRASTSARRRTAIKRSGGRTCRFRCCSERHEIAQRRGSQASVIQGARSVS
jgi:hypothetical protein